jgi:hypothetical protein
MFYINLNRLFGNSESRPAMMISYPLMYLLERSENRFLILRYTTLKTRDLNFLTNDCILGSVIFSKSVASYFKAMTIDPIIF